MTAVMRKTCSRRKFGQFCSSILQSYAILCRLLDAVRAMQIREHKMV